MDIGRPSTTTEVRYIIVMVQYYRDMWPRRSHMLAPLIEASSSPKGGKILWNDSLEISFKELNRMVYVETLLSYSYWKLPFTVHTDSYDKQLGAFIIHNNKTISLFSRKLSKPQRNCTTTDKELLAIVECLKQFRGIIFGYEINVLSDHNNLVYATTLSEYQRVMHWQLNIRDFGPNIQHISIFDNIVADTLSRLPSTPSNKYEPCTRKDQFRANNTYSKYLLFKAIPCNLLLWGCKSWALRKSLLASLEVFLHRGIRRILKIRMSEVIKQHITNTSIREKFYNIPTIKKQIALRQLTYLGKIFRREESHIPTRLLTVWCDHQRKSG